MRGLYLTVFVAGLLALVAAASPVTIEVVRTEPSRNFLLPRFGTVYLEIAYNSDQPLRLQAKGFRNGQESTNGEAMNASVGHPAGSGRALVWVSYGQAAEIDEIRVTAYDDSWRPLVALSIPRSVQWLGKSAETRAPNPAWVTDLIADERKIAEKYRADHPQEIGVLGGVMFAFMYIAIPGYVVLQVAALRLLAGGWRFAAMAPAVVMAAAAAHAVFALAAGSNIWPIVLLFTAPLAFIYLLALLAVGLLFRHARTA